MVTNAIHFSHFRHQVGFCHDVVLLWFLSFIFLLIILVDDLGPICTLQFLSLTLSPLSSHSLGSPDPQLPDTTLFVTVFFSKLPSRYFVLTGINQRPTGWYFSFTGICNSIAAFSALRGERVNFFLSLS